MPASISHVTYSPDTAEDENKSVSRLLRQEEVPGTMIGRQWRIRIADLDAALAAGTPHKPGPNGVAGKETGEDGSVDIRAIASLVGVGIVNLM